MGRVPLEVFAAMQAQSREGAKAKVIAVGDALEAARWAARRLRAMGYGVDDPVEVEATKEAVERAVGSALGSCDVIVVVGGVRPGAAPAFEGVAAALGRRLVESREAREHVEEYYALAGEGCQRAVEGVEALFTVPEGSTILRNPRGPAPGLVLEEGGTYVICVPGTLAEASAVLEEEADSYARSLVGASLSATVYVMTKTWEEGGILRALEEVSQRAPWVFAWHRQPVRSREGWSVAVTVFARTPSELSERLAEGVRLVEEALERNGVAFVRKDLGGI